MEHDKLSQEKRTPLLPNFQPLASLWEGSEPMYPSQQSARWAVRCMRRELVHAGALALHRNRTMVDLKKFAAVAEQAAIRAMEQRYGDGE